MAHQIASFVLATIFIALFLVFSLISYFDYHKKKFDFKNTFPYEINDYKITRENIYGKISFGVSLLALIFFYATYSLGLTNYHFGMAIFIGLMGIIGLLASAIIFFASFNNLKLHLAGDVLLFSSGIALNAGISFYTLWDLRDRTIPINILKIVIGAIVLLIMVVLILLVINPKMKEWNKLEEKTSEDGTVSYERPKRIILAYVEWLYFLILFIDALLLVTIS
ncbi:MAG: sodium/proton-translocating pyrophosphatase [Erysipelotrichia bacterium]|jgi:hypothetical protein|nr:hypothetical protein [Bacilli bacterium]NLB49213.1 sodium/proton-translocating pyrophosphatase [Erysipelotrichia bacterium]